MEWLKSLWMRFFPTKIEVDTPDLFRLKERQIYHYFDGQKVVDADPMILYRKMKDVSTDLEVEFKVYRSGMKGADEHYRKAVERIRGIFSLKPFEEGGLTEMECMNLLNHFWNYSGGVKKKEPPPSTPSTGTSDATPTSTANAPEETPPTKPTSDSGSTADEPTTKLPPEPHSESESPLE